jgi:7-keto-8-aminopelargonate synthetase-like enzyme
MAVADAEPVTGKWVSQGASARWSIDGASYLNFSGACYLALHQEPSLRQAAIDVIARGEPFVQQLPPNYGIRDAIFETVESAAANFMGTESAVYFATGFLIGQVGLCAHAKPGDHIYIDAGAHYNLVQAVRLVDHPVTQFPHRDPQGLKEAIGRTLRPGERPLIVTDGMFATTGDLAPLGAYSELIAPFAGRIFLDDAHAFGVLGENGRGTAEHFGVEDVAGIGATLSKAFCAQGAVVGCTREEALRVNQLPPKRGANAGSTISAAVSTASLHHVAANPGRRKELAALSSYARERLRELGLDISDSPSPVMAFKIGNRTRMRSIQARLFNTGIYLPISDYLGAGPEGLFRCAIFADHSIADIDRLASELGAAA